MFNRPMKNEQRFRLNRLADKLVTPERFTVWPWPSLVIFDEMDSAHPAMAYITALVNSDVPVSLIEQRWPTCPYGNEDCPLPHAAIGEGLHRPCLEDQQRRYIGRENDRFNAASRD